MVDTPIETSGAMTELTGIVKWFNNKAGFGFITVCGDGEYANKDVFVHHTAINTSSEQYKYLVQGEYVNFTLSECTDNEDHEHQANSVSGMLGGKLMCETRNEARARQTEDGDGGRPRRTDSRMGGGRGKGRGDRRGERREVVHVRGTGPREGEEWMLVRRKKPGSSKGSSTQNQQIDNEDDE